MSAHSASALIVLAVLLIVSLTMLAEAVVSRAHERKLRANGAVEPAGDVYAAMRIAYPACFAAMIAEAFIRGTNDGLLPLGVLIFATAKALKWWAIATLGERWSFRVLVVPGAPLVDAGPYRYLRHPNYLAILGELAGVALMLGAIWSGLAACVVFGLLLRGRIRIEEEALGYNRALERSNRDHY